MKIKKKNSRSILYEHILEDTKQTARMKELALNPWYSCSGEIYKLLSYEVMHKLVKKIKKGEVKLSSDLVYGKDVITTEEKFLENLDHYIGYVRDNYFIDHIEQFCIIELSLTNKYSEILYSLLDFHSEENYKIYHDQFRKMFMCNLYENAFFLEEFADDNTAIKQFTNRFRNYDFDSSKDIEKIEKVFKKIIQKRNNNLFNSFIPYKEYDEKNIEFYFARVDWVLGEYFKTGETEK